MILICVVSSSLSACSTSERTVVDAGNTPTDSAMDGTIPEAATQDAPMDAAMDLGLDATTDAPLLDLGMDAPAADLGADAGTTVPTWGCYESVRDNGDCDCGCGTPDPECPDNTIASCQSSWCGNLGLYLDEDDPSLCTDRIPEACDGIPSGGECTEGGESIRQCYFEDGEYFPDAYECPADSKCGELITGVRSCVLPLTTPCSSIRSECVGDGACWCSTEGACTVDYAAHTATCTPAEQILCRDEEEDTCVGQLFMSNCIPFALRADVLAGGRAEYADCSTLAGSTCVDEAGCLFAPGSACDPDARYSGCGTSGADFVECPESGICP